jgi:peptidoglycan L-alanyl-D-glutamate endopeptidase CwlK
MDAVSLARLQEVNPALSAKIYTLAEMLEPEGISFRVTQGFRTWAEQNALYAQGRTVPGSVVTEAQAAQSWHCYGCAVDVVLMDPAPDWNISDSRWQRIIAVGESLGLFSGSEFHDIKDNPHFQLTGRFPVTPDGEAQQIYQNEGAAMFWEEVNRS